MENSISFRFATLMILAGSILSACRQKDQIKISQKDTLFRTVLPKESGILFANELQETDSSNAIFYEYYYNGAGVAIGDINNDGLSDIFFGANMLKSRLYLNKGNLKFEDITEKCGINTLGKWVTGVSLADINQDGWLDIYLCVGGNISDDYHNLLYISNGNTGNLVFKECAASVGVDDDGYSTQAEFFDYDRDGDLDMFLVTSSIRVPNKNAIRLRVNDGTAINTNRLYRNDGIDPKTRLPVFHNVSRQAGIGWDGFGLGSCVCDINRDGWPDIYICNDYITNDLLYINQGDGTFKEMIKNYVKHISYSAMGMDIADFNNDGLADIFTLDMQPEDYYRKRIMAGNMRDYRRYLKELAVGNSPQYVRNMLQLNNGDIEGQYTFSEIGQLSGVSETDWSWVSLFADFDNDGYKDLFIGNGIPYDMTNMDFSALWIKKMKENPSIGFSVLYKILMIELNKKGNVKKPNVVYRNSGGLIFENKTTAWGLDQPLYSTSAAFSDLDNDGDLDLVLNNINDLASVYENTLIRKDSFNRNNHFLTLNLTGDSLNKGGIGAKISLYYGKQQQYYEHFPIRGYLSMVDPKIHFGLGEVTLIDSLHITWPDGKEQNLNNLAGDQVLSLNFSQASFSSKRRIIADNSNKVFTSQSGNTKIDYIHHERQFIDFDIQPLVPHQYSQEGPGITVGDVNSDGMDDFFIGGSTGFSGRIFVQQRTGSFISYPLPGNNTYEDMGALFFDVDGDGDQDLYVTSGGSGLPPGNQFYTDRLYINNGQGEFVPDKNALPDNRVCGSQVSAADFDKDGDLDLFVCGRVDLEKYPIPPGSFLLRNDSKGSVIRFTDVTREVCKDLERPGLVAAALWSDFNKDGWTDLILAGEWMPLTFFKNEQGKLKNVTSGTGLEKYTGWWNSLTSADFDKDGDIDYVAGNLGLNTQYKVTQDEPMQIAAKDFDMNGTLDPVCSYYVQGKSYPIYHRNLLLSQIPSLQNKYKTYEDYARATMADIFPDNSLNDAYIRESRFFETAYVENLGNGSFKLQSLPTEAQISPVYGMLSDDYNSDGNTDLLLVGNSYSSSIADGNYDASIGLFLSGNGKGGFTPVLGRTSGFFVDGDAKGMAELTMKDGTSLILVAQNSDSLKVIKPLRPPVKIISLKNDDVSAELIYNSGEKEYREFYYGSGYLSQSSRVCQVPEGVVSVSLTNYKGETEKYYSNQIKSHKMKQNLAINGGPKTIDKIFPWPVFDETDIISVADVVRSGKWGNPDCGDLVKDFEDEFAAFCGTKYALTCVNGSVALRLALVAIGVKPGDEVIIPPYTFIATASIVLEANCVPVFVDIDPDTYNLDPAKIEEAITKRTKAIIPVHFAGQACDMDKIMAIAKKHNLRVIEDACHGHGAEYKGKKLGSIGDAGCFSFQSSKNLTSGEGGMVITNDEKLYDMMNSLRNVGRVKGGQWYEHHNPGCNFRITQLQVVLLSNQLKRLKEQTRRRHENGTYLNSLLEKIEGIKPLARGRGETLHCYHIYIFKYDKSKFNNLPKSEFSQMLAAEGVPSFMGYPRPLYKQPLFLEKNFMCYAIPEEVDYTRVCCPVSEKACYEEAVWILQHAMLGTKEDMEKFAEAIIKIQESNNK